MRPRGKGYFLRLANGEKHRVTAECWRTGVERKWFVVAAPRIAKARIGVFVEFVGGQVHVTNHNIKFSYPIPSSWRAVERARVMATGGIREAGERQRAIQEMCGPLSVRNQITRPDIESFGTLLEMTQPTTGETL